MREVRWPLIGVVVALAVTALIPAGASASTWKFSAHNNYAAARGSIFYCDNRDGGSCSSDADIVVDVKAFDTPQRPSTSYVYLHYRDWSPGAWGNPAAWHDVAIGCSKASPKECKVPNGGTIQRKVHIEAQPWGAQVSVCTSRRTSRRSWHCGKPYRIA